MTQERTGATRKQDNRAHRHARSRAPTPQRGGVTRCGRLEISTQGTQRKRALLRKEGDENKSVTEGGGHAAPMGTRKKATSEGLYEANKYRNGITVGVTRNTMSLERRVERPNRIS